METSSTYCLLSICDSNGSVNGCAVGVSPWSRASMNHRRPRTLVARNRWTVPSSGAGDGKVKLTCSQSVVSLWLMCVTLLCKNGGSGGAKLTDSPFWAGWLGPLDSQHCLETPTYIDKAIKVSNWEKYRYTKQKSLIIFWLLNNSIFLCSVLWLMATFFY